jgi:ribosome-binding protein aMBF1 (putative translation factor)
MNLEDSANQSTGTEECSVCGRLVTNYNRLYVVVDTDNYVCKACAKFAKSKVKSAKIV